MKKWTYHVSHKFTQVKGDKKIFALTQLYQIGVYMIINNDPSLQFNVTPSQMVATEKRLNKSLEKGEIKDLEYGRSITVTDETGFFTEIQ